MKPNNAVSLRDVQFAYAGSPPVLDIDTLDIPTGQSVFLNGPSGSGKTTLLSLIAGVLVPQSGKLEVLGHQMTQLSPAARDTLRGAHIGYIFQRFSLVPYLTVGENIALPCRLHPSRKARIVAPELGLEVDRLARRLDLHVKLNTRVAHLTVGQQQRVAIARALIGSPALVIADEPTSSLDMDRREAFLALLTEMVRESSFEGHVPTSLLFVSHDRSLAGAFDHVVSLPEINRAAAGRVA